MSEMEPDEVYKRMEEIFPVIADPDHHPRQFAFQVRVATVDLQREQAKKGTAVVLHDFTKAR